MYATEQTQAFTSQSPNRSALVVGAGALGSAALLAIARSASLRATIADPDTVELSNLPRQVLFEDSDIGQQKASCAAARLRTAHGYVWASPLERRVDEFNAWILAAAHDVIIDACDDPRTKFLLNKVAVETRTPLIHGGAVGTSGQWMTILPGRSACLACVFPDQDRLLEEAIPEGGRDPFHETAEGCAGQGILAPVAGIIGSMQGLAAVSVLEAGEHPEAGKMEIYSTEGTRQRAVDFPRDPACRRCGKLDA